MSDAARKILTQLMGLLPGAVLPRLKQALERMKPAAREEASADEPKLSMVPHLVYGLCAVMTTSFLVWAAVSTLDIVSVANGEVTPSTSVKRIQHLEGGIVSQILVREGARVTKDQPLVVLAPTSSFADVSELEVRLNSLRVDIARFEALLKGEKKPTFDEDLVRDHPQLVAQAQQAFDVAMRRHLDEIDRQRQTVLQKTHAIEELKTRTRNRQRNLGIIREQVKISESLLADNLTNRYKHLDLLKELSTIEGSIEEDRATLVTAEATLNEAVAAQKAIKSAFDNENRKSLDDARLSHRELSQRMQKFKDSFERTTLRSPVEGIVKTIHIATIGGVVKAGEPVVEIVPEDDRLIVEAKLATQDIGYVEVGQPAMVRLASAEANRFGGLDGRVISVSPDTLLTPDGMPFYKVRIETEKAHFESHSLRYNLFPGMQVVASIRTGTRTVMEYLLDPYLSRLTEAMRER